MRSPFIIAALLLSASARAGTVAERVVAVVNDDIILQTELDQWAVGQLRALPDLENPEGRKQWEAHRRKVLDQMIDSRLTQLQATELKINVTPEEIDRAVEEVKKQNNLTDAQFVEALKQQSFTLEGYRKNLRRQLLELHVISTAVRSRVTVTEDEVRAAYKQNERSISGDRQAHLRQILVATHGDNSADELEKRRKVALKVVELARSGTSFAELAKQYSDDDSTKASGGDLGFVAKGALVDEIEDAVAAMEPGDVRGPLRVATGWMVLQLVERKAGDLRPYEEVKEQLHKQLYDQQVEKATQAWIKELRKKAHIDIRL
jgi:peptidyl-prolyl cis-trans isomerase SurA